MPFDSNEICMLCRRCSAVLMPGQGYQRGVCKNQRACDNRVSIQQELFPLSKEEELRAFTTWLMQYFRDDLSVVARITILKALRNSKFILPLD